MTGAFNTAGKAVVNGALLYLKQHGDTVAGRKIQVIVRDDATTPDAAKRLAQELIVNEKVADPRRGRNAVGPCGGAACNGGENPDRRADVGRIGHR